MAQYEEKTDEVVSRIEDSDLDSGTKASIREALEGREDTMISQYDGAATDAEITIVGPGQKLENDPGSKVVIVAQGAPGADVTIDASNGERIVVAGGGDDQIIVQGDAAVTVETGGGNDIITAGQGEDTIVINGDGNNSVDTGDGDDTIVLDTSGGSSSVEGGQGFDSVDVSSDSRAQHEFIRSEDGGLTLHSAETQLSGVELVQFSDSLTVIADNADKAAAGRLYEVVFGREADVGGIRFWMDQVDTGKSIQDIAAFFIASDEFKATYSESMTNEEFVAKLYENSFGRSADESGFTFWTAQLEQGEMTRADVALTFAESQEALTLMGIDGTQYVIDVSTVG